MSDEKQFEVVLTREDGYRYRVDYPGLDVPPVHVDEPPPLGEGAGPNPARLLATAVASCLSASLQFCLEKARIDLDGVKARVEGTMTRNERGRFRITGFHVTIEPALSGDEGRLQRCLDLFEDFCIVTESVRHGIPVSVDVRREGGAADLDAPSAPLPGG